MSASQRLYAKSPTSVMLESQANRKGVVRVSVEVTPELRDLPQGDVILRAYINGKEIEVVFPSDRRAEAMQLVSRLRRSLEQAKAAARLSGREPKPQELRQKLHIDGVWRVRLMEEERGMPVRRFQLVAARWRYQSAEGVVHVDGSVPYG